MAPKLSLEKTQFWMLEVILHPGTNEEAVGSPKARAIVSERRFPRVVLPSKTLNSYLRIGIYRDMYLARLRDALASDYPALVHYLGDDAFTRLVSGYVQAYPSRSYTLNRLGDHLPEYIRSTAGLPRREFLFDLALLELAMSHVFDAEESPVLTPEAIAAVPSDSWEKVRLKPIRAFRLLNFRYPVNAYLQSVKEGTAHPSMRRKNNWVVVFRRNYTLWRLDVTRQAHDLLQSLVTGKPLGKALSTSLTRNRHSVSEVQLFTWFREWVADGLFQAIEQTS
jgi:putative DNA-binding protein